MNHPSSENWMAYLYGEMPSHEKLDADAHLAVCPVCRDSIDQWRGTMKMLDSDRAIEAMPRSGIQWQGVARWAAAAAVMLGTGFVAGRWNSPSRAELQSQVAAMVGDMEQSLRDQYSEEFAKLRSEATATAVGQQRALTDAVGQLNELRLQDQHDWAVTLRRVEDRRSAELGDIRSDLVSLALRTGSGFRQAESQLNLLASYLPSDESSSSSSEFPSTPVFEEK
jgi:hypothetical protein